MKLSEARVLFSSLLTDLEVWMKAKGYLYARGEGADFVTAKDPSTDHMHPGLHGLGLAQDYALYYREEEGQPLIYLTDSEDYRDLNEYWQSLHPFCRAGIDFGDGNHVSLSDHSIPGCVTSDGRLRK